MLLDIDHDWGGDLSVGPTGDLMIAPLDQVSRQRVIRRLLTASHSYLWHPDYGAGLGRYVGATVIPREIEAIVRHELMSETSIASSPPPVIAVADVPPIGSGALLLNISYRDAWLGSSLTLGISVG